MYGVDNCCRCRNNDAQRRERFSRIRAVHKAQSRRDGDIGTKRVRGQKVFLGIIFESRKRSQEYFNSCVSGLCDSKRSMMREKDSLHGILRVWKIPVVDLEDGRARLTSKRDTVSLAQALGLSIRAWHHVINSFAHTFFIVSASHMSNSTDSKLPPIHDAMQP